MKQTQTTAANFLFPNLFAAIKAEHAKRLTEFTEAANKETDFNKWIYTDLLTASKKINNFASIEDLRAYLIARKTKAIQKSIDKEFQHLNIVSSAETFTGAKVSMEWKNNRTWGANPTAEAWANDGYFKSGSIGGCGYDKGSTAVAQALNQSNAMLKAFYLVKENNIGTDNRTLFGYGSGYGLLPRLEGGVGVSCYPKIFASIGYEFTTQASGRAFDAYSITKKTTA